MQIAQWKGRKLIYRRLIYTNVRLRPYISRNFYFLYNIHILLLQFGENPDLCIGDITEQEVIMEHKRINKI